MGKIASARMINKNLVILEKWRSPPEEIANKVNSNPYLFKSGTRQAVQKAGHSCS